MYKGTIPVPEYEAPPVLANLEEITDPGCSVTAVGAIKSVKLVPYRNKEDSPTERLEIVIRDSKRRMQVTLFGEMCTANKIKLEPAASVGKIAEFENFVTSYFEPTSTWSLVSKVGSVITLDPKTPAAVALKNFARAKSNAAKMGRLPPLEAAPAAGGGGGGGGEDQTAAVAAPAPMEAKLYVPQAPEVPHPAATGSAVAHYKAAASMKTVTTKAVTKRKRSK